MKTSVIAVVVGTAVHVSVMVFVAPTNFELVAPQPTTIMF